jgi:AcrR family transcriptional regulator
MEFPSPASATTVRDRILFTAAGLFYREGVRAVGIDRIIADAETAKATFYRHFKAKDDLVLAYLYLRHDQWLQWFVDRLGQACDTRGLSFERVAEVLAEWFAEADFRGCAFINVLSEGVPTGEILSVAQSHKADLQDALEGLARRMSHPHVELVAEEALLVVEGAIVRAQMTRDDSVPAVAARLLRRLDPPSRRPRS